MSKKKCCLNCENLEENGRYNCPIKKWSWHNLSRAKELSCENFIIKRIKKTEKELWFKETVWAMKIQAKEIKKRSIEKDSDFLRGYARGMVYVLNKFIQAQKEG